MKEVNGSDGQKSYQYKKQSSELMGKTSKPVWFLFPGLGGQWPAMAKAFMPIDIFANKIEECAQILKTFNIDLKHMLLNDDKNSISTMTNKFVTTTSMQIALVEVLKKLDITPDGIIGHSFGEIACAYADGCLTTEEALLTSYWRGVITESDNKIPKGLMAAVGLSYYETIKMCPKGVDVVCDNSKDSVTISGKKTIFKKIYQRMSEIFFFTFRTNNNINEIITYSISYRTL
jgi:fatty acid synthase